MTLFLQTQNAASSYKVSADQKFILLLTKYKKVNFNSLTDVYY